MKWVAFFSQTGSEIVEISKRLNRTPDIIITNNRPSHLRTINRDVLTLSPALCITPNKPAVTDYLRMVEHLPGDPNQTLITLHGWLRVIPEEIIKQYPYIYNGHPGLISRYPELKGKDPQLKAWDLNLDTSGCVIHKVTAGVDEGPVLKTREVPIRNLSLDELYDTLHKTSVDLWVEFLKRNWFPG
jgi:folate-dependent phosphoribosylglycinamide formyltransferase PurN